MYFERYFNKEKSMPFGGCKGTNQASKRRGRLIWSGGTYVRAIHGKIGS